MRWRIPTSRNSWRWRIPAFLAAAIVVFLAAGCNGSKHPATPSRTDPVAVLGDGQRKDEAITTEANAIVAAPADSALVEAAAKRILDVLRLSPWARTEATIKALVGERDAALKGSDAKDAQIAKLEKDLREMRDAFHNWFRRGCYIAGALFMALGVASFFALGQIAGFSPWLAARMGPRISGAIVAFGATLLGIGIAYGWALEHRAIVYSALGAVALIAAIYFHANHLTERAKAAPVSTP